ncbi:MAG TPA: hypothetical protein VNH19_20005 [Candidatus Limnocylindrales bacterium]|nr:hypothetical protein [Candidatus Limnocylindrales bacterium]
MDNLSKPERANSARAEIKRPLLRLAVFFFVLFTTHWLLHLFHPIGVQWFFLSLALGTLAASVAVSRLIPLLERGFRD